MAHDYPMNAFRKMRCGGGDTALNGPDFIDPDGRYDIDDWKGCYLVPMTLDQLQVIMNRVKTWRITVTYFDGDGASQSYTFDTPSSPNYRVVSGYREDAGTIDWLKSDGAYGVSMQEVSNERDFQLNNDFRGQSVEFEEVVTGADAISLQTSFSVGNSALMESGRVDYYLKDADGTTALTYDGQSEVYATLQFFAWDASTSNLFYLSSVPYDIDFSVAPDRITDAITITTCAGIVTADVLSEGAIDGFSFEIAALEYWTYGGKFDSSTGQPT